MNWVQKQISRASNYYFPTNEVSATPPVPTRQDNAKDMRNYIGKVQLARIKQDILTWRDAIREAELAWYPHRVKMQQMYLDTTLNGHIFACLERRRNLTLLRKFHICSQNGVTNDSATLIIQKQWFREILKQVLNAQFYGYSLINWNEVKNNELKGLKIIRRANISPDRLNVTSYFYMLSGLNFTDETLKDDAGNKYVDWSLWCPTPSDDGISTCGYGLLYRVALYEIFMRNNMSYNAEFVEKFVMPLIVGKTTKTEDHERDELEQGLKNLASSAVAVIDPTDEIELHESKNSGSGFQSYDNFENRCEKKVSKILLGHADAIDSTAGKLGSMEEIQEALEDIQSTDANFVEPFINDILLPKLRLLGFNIPLSDIFKFQNDSEIQEERKKEDEMNLVTATMAKTFSDAGYEVDEKYLSERTKMVIKKKEVVTPPIKLDRNVQNKLDEMYELG